MAAKDRKHSREVGRPVLKREMLDRIKVWKGAFETHPLLEDEWSADWKRDNEVMEEIKAVIEKYGD